MPDAADDFRRFIEQTCGTDPGAIIADGRWHRFNIANTRNRSSKPGRYLLHADEKPVGIFMDWRDESKRHRWFSDTPVSTEARTAITERRQARDAQRKALTDAAAKASQAYWAKAVNGADAAAHPYLVAKGVGSHGARVRQGALLIPLYNADGELRTLQRISDNGSRLFWKDSEKAGCYCPIGDFSGEQPIVLCEGFSTGATIYEATGYPVAACIDAGNLVEVSRWAGHKWPDRQFIVAGEDDHHLVARGKANKGKECAEAARRNLGAWLVYPNMHGLDTPGGDDFNDMAREIGIDDVREVFEALTRQPAPPPETPLPLIWAKDTTPVLNNNWIIKRTIPAEGFVSVIGEPGCGKSFFILDVACHIAAGLDWRGRKTKQGLVVYLAAEGQRGQMNRIEAWKGEHGITDMSLALVPVAINLRDASSDIPKLIETIEVAVAVSGLPLSVLVVDTLNRSFGGGDENGEDMGAYVGNADKLQKHFGCTTVHVHHIPKSGDLTERGHGSLRGAIDTSLGVVNDKETGKRTLICLKQKDGVDGWKLGFGLKLVVLGQDEDGEDVTTCVVEDQGDSDTMAKRTGPALSATQRRVFAELMATLEAAPEGIPSIVPEGLVPWNVGKVVSREVWRDRYVAVTGGDDSSRRAFNRAVLDLQNKKLVGGWNDVIWPIWENGTNSGQSGQNGTIGQRNA